jgi:DNA invertase Pin-like site-specific DNA recombinase
MPDYTAYYRVSTEKQGRSGLGLEAQREAVTRFAGTAPISEYVEIESGRRHENRPQLKAAMEECKKHHHRLVIAKLDRLARNVHFISGLMESGVDFVAADMPQANKLTIHILAAVAEHEREIISQRIKGALAIKKAQLALVGKKLGGPRPMEALALANAAKQRATPPAEVLTLMRGWRQEHKSFWTIAGELNRLGVRTGRGSRWYASTVRLQLTARREPSSEAAGEPPPLNSPSDDQHQPITPSPPTEPPQRTYPLNQNGVPMTRIEYAAFVARRLAQVRR